MSTKRKGRHQPPTVADVARMKAGFAQQQGGATPPPPHLRRIEAAAAKAATKGSK